MPTGYTYDIENDVSFENFALSCARAFGACAHMRDTPSKENPTFRVVSTYYQDKLPEALAEYGYLQTLTDKQKEEFGQEERDKEITRIQETLEKKRKLEAKYNEMLNKVGAWNPPTSDHNGLKEFMTRQIVESIQFDCDSKYTLEDLQRTISKKPIDFYRVALANAENEVKQCEEELEKEEKRVAESNAWIAELYKSLGIDYV